MSTSLFTQSLMGLAILLGESFLAILTGLDGSPTAIAHTQGMDDSLGNFGRGALVLDSSEFHSHLGYVVYHATGLILSEGEGSGLAHLELASRNYGKTLNSFRTHLSQIAQFGVKRAFL